jgi:CubicO group peptidase (beta-lactamase class C family)
MRKTILLLIILSILLIGCKSAPAGQYTYRPPENIDDGLDVGTLEEVNLDPTLIEKAVNKILSGEYPEVHSMLIFKDNKLVLEEYFTGYRYKWDGRDHHGSLVTWDRDKPHMVMSVSKSIASACVGIAIEQGFIESVQQSIFDYLPEHQHLNTDGKDRITIEHLLTMTSGLEWNETDASYTSSENDSFRMWVECEDQIACVLEKPLVHEPGTSFTYCGGGIVILGEIVKNATQMRIDEFCAETLFEPLGIDPPVWSKYRSGVIDTAGGFRITPRDMVKFGVMFLQDGLWNGEQIVSGQWVRNSAAPYPGNERIELPGDDSGSLGYSYAWWTRQVSKSGRKIDAYYADGWGGQLVMVLPELDTVVVFTGGNYVTQRPDFEILEKVVLRAID